ncbi:MAG: hypothetical protein FJ206_07970 [Gemmatimonadetes bacterium]|nr:hypothetical protein [Gemmatimonadota bacterium]
MRSPETARALAEIGRPLRRAGVAAVLVAGLAAGLVALAVPAWLARLGVVSSPLWVPLAWAGALIVVGLASLSSYRLIRRFEPGPLAERLEGRDGWRRGSVGGVLADPADGTSPELLAAADRTAAGAIRTRGEASLAPERERWAKRGRFGGVALAVALTTLLGAGTTSGPASLLWSPGEAWATFLAPVRLAADRVLVDRGEGVRLDIVAVGRPGAELWTRSVGESWRAEPVTLDSAGRATLTSGPLTGDVYYFAASGGRTSDTVFVKVRLPAFLGALALTAKYPSYLGLEDEPLPTTGDTLLLPAGTRIAVAGETTALLRAAQFTLGTARFDLDAGDRTFTGLVVPRASGELRLGLEMADGAPLGGDPIRIPVIVVPDAPPIVEVPVPGQDTMAVLGKELAMVIDVRDDHGIAGVQVVAAVQRGSRAPVVLTVPLPPSTGDRALLSTRLELAGFGLAPGDTMHYWVQAKDNAPAVNLGRSATFVLYVPTTAEARAEQRNATEQFGKKIDSLVAQSRSLQRQTEDLSRERNRANASERNDPTLGFDDAKRAEQVARDQQELMDRAEEARERLENLEEAAERGGIADSAFQRQLEEIRAQLDKALTPEMRQRLDELREALKNLDPQATKDALRKLAEAQQRLKEALERTRELFKRAALEGELGGLQQESKELAEQQRDWNERVATADSSQAAAREEGLAERTDSLAQGLDQAAKRLEEGERQEALQENANNARQAAQQMREAAKSAKGGKRQQAKKQGERAAEQMGQIEQDVKEQREEQQEEWREEVIAALDRALAETARLSQRQLAVAHSVGRGATLNASRHEQGLIEEGVQKILEQILSVGGKNALVSPQIGTALVQARLQMAKAREAVSSASANLREAAEQAGEAVDALNVAAYQMLRSRDDVSGSSSGSGLAEAMQRMQQLAGQQGSISQEGNELLSMLANQQRMQAQMQAMAQRQRQLAEELERLRAETQAPGTRDLAEEARELARKLEAGRLDRETVDRQERLFKRMLDAGRTLQGQEEDEKKDRESTAAKGDSLSVPGPLRRLLDGEGRLRLPSWEDLQRLSPQERRLVTDYFRRLAASRTRQ